MIATNDNLEAIAREAVAAKYRGATTYAFEIEALTGFTKYVSVWEGYAAEVVDRVFESSDEPPNPDLPNPRNVKYFKVRMRIADITEAWRRRQEREATQFGGVTA
ncbi:MAG TPA: hypothetical protein VGI19_02725 [Candidatus Cybelea sp.]|jgi:hypothetical protein